MLPMLLVGKNVKQTKSKVVLLKQQLLNITKN